MSIFKSLLTRDNITLAIAIIGMLLSIYNFVHGCLQNRMKISVIYKNHHLTKTDCKSINISLCLENLVKEPIAISRMFLNINSESYEFFWVPQFIYYADYKDKDEILDVIKLHSVTLPARLEGNGVLGGFFFVDVKKPITNDELADANTSITIHSNKGIKTYTIAMDNVSVEL